MKCGLLGQTLGHSYSPRIHRELGDYEYRLYETEPEELEAFLLRGDWDGLNVTIPYKKAVVPYCAALSDTARALGSVNTLVRRADGSLYGDNTDFGGFESLVLSSGIPVAGQKALVLGSGGASVTVCAVLSCSGAAAARLRRSRNGRRAGWHQKAVGARRLLLLQRNVRAGPRRKATRARRRSLPRGALLAERTTRTGRAARYTVGGRDALTAR